MYGVSVTSIANRLKDELAMDTLGCPAIVLSAEEKNYLESTLIWVALR